MSDFFDEEEQKKADEDRAYAMHALFLNIVSMWGGYALLSDSWWKSLILALATASLQVALGFALGAWRAYRHTEHR